MTIYPRRIHPLRTTKGASLTEYGILVALIGTTAIAAVFGTGMEISSLFGRTADNLEQARLNTGGQPGTNPTQPGTDPSTEVPEDCYLDEAGNSILAFDAASGIACVDLADGADTLNIDAPNGATVFGGAGAKTITTGNGGDIIRIQGPALAQTSGQKYAIITQGGDDTVYIGGGAAISTDTGAGNDTITFRNADIAAAGGQFWMTGGTGTNTVDLSCAEGSSAAPIFYMAKGQDEMRSDGCSVYLLYADVLAGENATTNLHEVDMTMQGGTLAAMGQSRMTKLSINATDLDAASAGFNISNSMVTGPVTLNFEFKDDSDAINFGKQVNLISGGDPGTKPVSLRLYHPVTTEGYDENGNPFTNLIQPAKHWDIDVEAHFPRITTSFTPTDGPNIDFPKITSPNGGMLRLELGSTEWNVQLSNDQGDTQDIDCARNNLTWVRGQEFTRLTTTHTGTGRTFTTDFNGGEGWNGSTFELEAFQAYCYAQPT